MRAAKTLIVSLNPAVDCEWRVPTVRWEEKNNILEERRWAGGKGSNVARWLRHLGGRPELLLPLGGSAGDELAGYLQQGRVPTRIVPLKAPTRVNVIVTANSGQIRFNPLGPMISASEWRRLLGAAQAFCREQKSKRGSPLLILSGALPRGVPITAYEAMLNIARESGIRAFLDCDGPAFAAGIRAKPFLVKPNIHELAQWWGKRFDLKRAVTRLSEITAGWVLVSRDAEGALLWNSCQDTGFSMYPPNVRVRNTVGAGDALIAAVAHQVQLGSEPEHWLRAGVATATAAVENKGGVLASQAAMTRIARQLKVEPLDF